VGRGEEGGWEWEEEGEEGAVEGTVERRGRGGEEEGE